MPFLQRHCCHLCERGPPCPAPAVQRAAEADHADEQRQHARQRRARVLRASQVGGTRRRTVDKSSGDPLSTLMHGQSCDVQELSPGCAARGLEQLGVDLDRPVGLSGWPLAVSHVREALQWWLHAGTRAGGFLFLRVSGYRAARFARLDLL